MSILKILKKYLRKEAFEEISSDTLSTEDFYINDQGFQVFTKTYLLKRGYCCKNGCLHCPYGFKK